MNSKQRRKDSRLWKYSVKIRTKDFGHYEEMWEWLKEHYTSRVDRCGWRDRHSDFDYVHYGDESFDVVWEFTDKKKLVEFSLRWL